VTLILVFAACYALTRLLQTLLRSTVLPRTRLDAGGRNALLAGVGYVGFAVAAIAAVSAAGLNLSNIAIVAGALSVGIGFGLQSIINNFVSGLILLVERPIKVGDRVSVKGQEGFVRRISVRSTEIETGDRASLIVPNSEFIIGTVTNWTHRNALGQVVVKVHVGYQTDPERVRDILQKVGAECPLVLQYPAPGVGFDNFGPNALEFSLSAVVPDVTKASSVQSDLRFRILKAFRAAGIEMPYPQHDVHLRDLDTVRALLMRFAEERAQKREAAVMDAKKEEPKS
jgi:small-conductance mechanosensitive channel